MTDTADVNIASTEVILKEQEKKFFESIALWNQLKNTNNEKIDNIEMSNSPNILLEQPLNASSINPTNDISPRSQNQTSLFDSTKLTSFANKINDNLSNNNSKDDQDNDVSTVFDVNEIDSHIVYNISTGLTTSTSSESLNLSNCSSKESVFQNIIDDSNVNILDGEKIVGPTDDIIVYEIKNYNQSAVNAVTNYPTTSLYKIFLPDNLDSSNITNSLANNHSQFISIDDDSNDQDSNVETLSNDLNSIDNFENIKPISNNKPIDEISSINTLTTNSSNQSTKQSNKRDTSIYKKYVTNYSNKSKLITRVQDQSIHKSNSKSTSSSIYPINAKEYLTNKKKIINNSIIHRNTKSTDLSIFRSPANRQIHGNTNMSYIKQINNKSNNNQSIIWLPTKISHKYDERFQTTQDILLARKIYPILYDSY